MKPPNPIGLAIVLPTAIYLCGIVTGVYLCLRFYVHTRAHKPESVETREIVRPSGIDSYWMEQGDIA